MKTAQPESDPGDSVRIELLPLGETLSTPRGTALRDLLFAKGVEFPCGGRGRCRGCRIKLLEGELPLTEDESRLLSREEFAAGWRLACCGTANENLKIELAQWEAPILADDSEFSFSPRDGHGVAVDLGTTTVVAQLIDLNTGVVLAVKAALNSQARHGADIMSRIEHATRDDGQATLRGLIREQIGELIADLRAASAESAADIVDVVIVGNTVMHHLFCGIDVTPLSQYPFEPENEGLVAFRAEELGWELPPDATVRFLPCLGGFVGSDILAGILATRIHEQDSPQALIDLGTNGEIVIGNRGRMLAASTAVGPAFEGARISMGMRAATGAISEVVARNHRLECRVQGNVPARGICGSGLVDAVAAGLELQLVHPSGRLVDRETLELSPPVELTQWDIRELQLAKGAIAAGIRLLAKQWGASLDDFSTIYLAGAFGNYINHSSARRIGLLTFPPKIIRPAGNTALLGAKLALFEQARDESPYQRLLDTTQHVSLSADPAFQDIFVEELHFPS